jgi:cytochrome P450 family 110
MGLPAGPRFVLPWLLRYTRSPYRVWRALVRRYQDPFFVRLPETPGTVATGHPEGVKAIISADASTLVPWRLPATEALLTDDSIFLQAGDAHRTTRKLLAPLFQPARHDAHCATMAAVVDAALAGVAPGPLVVHPFAQRLTLQIILAVLFGLRDGPLAERFHAVAKRALDDNGPTFLFVRFLRRRASPFARVIDALEELRALVQDELERRRASSARRPPAAGCPAGRDMLDQLMQARRADGTPLSDREICVHLSDMVVAGHETTTVAIAWTCYELCRNPAVMARLVAELDGHPVPRTAAALAELRYLEAVCHESLRLHAPLVFLTRQAAKPITVHGHEVPAGYGVSLVLPLIHGDPATFPDPERFRPERFLERNYGPHQYLPFGGGAKRCLGASFAVQEMMIVLAGLLTRFELRLRRDRVVRPRARAITIAPAGGVELVIARRAERPAVSAVAAPARRDGSCPR